MVGMDEAIPPSWSREAKWFEYDVFYFHLQTLGANDILYLLGIVHSEPIIILV